MRKGVKQVFNITKMSQGASVFLKIFGLDFCREVAIFPGEWVDNFWAFISPIYTRFGLIANVIASVFQRSNPLKIKKLLRQKTLPMTAILTLNEYS